MKGEDLSELELTLTVLWHSTRRWLSQRSTARNINGLSDLDTFILHFLVLKNRKLRGIDLAFALAIDDLHLVTYSLKKLTRMRLTTSTKVGKEVFFEYTKEGKDNYADFQKDRKKYLEPLLTFLNDLDGDMTSLNNHLRALSSAYDQAARLAASATLL